MKKYTNSNKNHSHRIYGPSLSDIFSSDVLHSILSSPTDTLQALNEAIDATKVRNKTESTKTKIKNFLNGDFKINFNGSFEALKRDLRKLFSMNRFGGTDYAVYEIPTGRMAFRLSDHNANGNKFEQDETEVNISVFVAFKEYNVPESKIPFTEFKIKPEIFESKRENVIRAIIIAVQNALNGDDFDIPEEFADRVDYPLNNSEINTQNDKTENSNLNYNMAKNSKRLYENIMNDVSKSVRRKMYENYVEDNEYLYDDIMESVGKIVRRNLNEAWGADLLDPKIASSLEPKKTSRSARLRNIIDELDKESEIAPYKLQKISDLISKYKIEDETLIEALVNLISYASPIHIADFVRQLSRSGYEFDDRFFNELKTLLKNSI